MEPVPRVNPESSDKVSATPIEAPAEKFDASQDLYAESELEQRSERIQRAIAKAQSFA